MSACLCVHVCVRIYVRVCARVCVCVSVLCMIATLSLFPTRALERRARKPKLGRRRLALRYSPRGEPAIFGVKDGRGCGNPFGRLGVPQHPGRIGIVVLHDQHAGRVNVGAVHVRQRRAVRRRGVRVAKLSPLGPNQNLGFAGRLARAAHAGGHATAGRDSAQGAVSVCVFVFVH
jgi:hypothetical protein